MGSFQPRLLKVDGLDKFDDTQLFYRVRNPAQFAGKNLVIVGGGDSALDWALNFVQEGPQPGRERDPDAPPRRLPAAPASGGARCASCATRYEMQFIVGQVTGFEEQRRPPDRPQGDRRRRRHARWCRWTCCWCSSACRPSSGPIAEWGLDIERKQIVVDTEKFETSMPGIFAVGDINTYPGKKKLILSGFHEAALAAFGAAPYHLPGQAHPPAVHDHQPEAAQGAGRGDAGLRLDAFGTRR